MRRLRPQIVAMLGPLWDKPQRRKPKLPNIHDPNRTPAPQAARRAAQKERYESMTPQEIIRETPQKQLEAYAQRGAPMAIEEVARRMAVREAEAVSA